MKSQRKKIVAFLRFSLDTVGEHFIYEEAGYFQKYFPFIFCGIVKRMDQAVHYYYRPEFAQLYKPQWPEIPEECGDIYRDGMKRYHEVARRLRIKLFHAQFLTDADFFAPLVRACGLPFVVSLRGYDLFHPKAQFFLTRVLPLVSKFTVKSQSMKDMLISYGCDPDKIAVIYGGIDPGVIPFQPRLPDQNEIRILSAGRFVEKKGHDVALAFFRDVLKDYPDARLTLIGEGPLRDKIFKRCSDFGISGSVDIKGYMPHALFIEEFYRHNLFVLPSRQAENGDREGIPNVLKEAMASGMPVISTYHSGIPELITHQETGYLVEENDHRGICDQLNFLIRHKAEALQVCRRARAFVEKRFHVKNSADQMEALYDNVLSEGVHE